MPFVDEPWLFLDERDERTWGDVGVCCWQSCMIDGSGFTNCRCPRRAKFCPPYSQTELRVPRIQKLPGAPKLATSKYAGQIYGFNGCGTAG